MLESFYLEITKREPRLQKCDQGVAFLNAAKALYGLSSVSYIAINVPKGNQYLHCAYSDSCIRQKVTFAPLATEALKDLGLLSPLPVNWMGCERLRLELKLRMEESGVSLVAKRALSFSLSALRGETALFAAAGASEPSDGPEVALTPVVAEWRILANYFHSQILRLNGHDTFDSLLMSARELDCLKWTAAGKTAWEASKILGISERTVIFHLNAARKKLNCATTTQAVAKAVATQLISI